MPSPDETLQKYEQAEAALDAIARSRAATDDQRNKARQARDALTREFVGNAIIEVEARTVQFQDFIKRMERAIDDLGGNSPLPALQQLQSVVDQAKTLLAGANDAGAGPGDLV